MNLRKYQKINFAHLPTSPKYHMKISAFRPLFQFSIFISSNQLILNQILIRNDKILLDRFISRERIVCGHRHHIHHMIESSKSFDFFCYLPFNSFIYFVHESLKQKSQRHSHEITTSFSKFATCDIALLILFIANMVEI